ncbi:MAG TPA: hypothetical protein VEZ88_10905 [Steroidobacteraceae bacterium]|nr:hypothetical protein [Steroidobacteraceae bacterium]
MRRLKFYIAVLPVCALLASPAFALGTIAGTAVSSPATATFVIGGVPGSVQSGPATFLVAEILDLNITRLSSTVSVSAGDLNRILLFRLTNTGNGNETFPLSIDNLLGGDNFDPQAAVPAIYFDSDASGDLSVGDVAYVPGSNDPTLAPDASIAALLVNNIPASVADGSIGRSALHAQAATGTGAPGTAFPGQGTGGTDAVAGAKGGQAEVFGEYLVGDVQVSLAKTVTVVDPAGGASTVPGARLNYQIVVTVAGTGTAHGFVFTDPVPAGTAYATGSLRLNSTGLSDAADGDAGELVAGATPSIRVALGDLTQAAGPKTIAFTVTIN